MRVGAGVQAGRRRVAATDFSQAVGILNVLLLTWTMYGIRKIWHDAYNYLLLHVIKLLITANVKYI